MKPGEDMMENMKTVLLTSLGILVLGLTATLAPAKEITLLNV